MEKGAKIFGIGLSKTGTTSLYSALEILGYRSATFRHMKALSIYDWICGDFSRDYLSTFDAVTNLPMATYFRELDQRYPGSKFILTNRDVDPWLESIERQFSKNAYPDSQFDRDIRLAQYGVITFNEARFRRIHAEHQSAVAEYFADRPDDLLQMNVFEGDHWDPLCKFLNKPVPNGEFPTLRPGLNLSDNTGVTPPNNRAGSFGCFAFVIPVDQRLRRFSLTAKVIDDEHTAGRFHLQWRLIGAGCRVVDQIEHVQRQFTAGDHGRALT